MSDEPIEAEQVTPPQPQQPQQTILDKAVEKTNNFVGWLQFQVTLLETQRDEYQEALKKAAEENATLRDQIRVLEEALQPFLVTQPPAETQPPASGAPTKRRPAPD